MREYRYRDTAVRCPECESTGALTKEIPAHRREWYGTDADVVEHMPAALDRECPNCEHHWTDYPEGTR